MDYLTIYWYNLHLFIIHQRCSQQNMHSNILFSLLITLHSSSMSSSWLNWFSNGCLHTADHYSLQSMVGITLGYANDLEAPFLCSNQNFHLLRLVTTVPQPVYLGSSCFTIIGSCKSMPKSGKSYRISIEKFCGCNWIQWQSSAFYLFHWI